MGKIIMFVTTSLDGYSTKHNGDTAWIRQAMLPAEDYGLTDLMSNVGAYILGATTYRAMEKMGVEERERQVPTYLVSQRQALTPDQNRYVNGGDLALLVQRLKAEVDKDIWLLGGGDLITQGLRLNLIEEIILMVAPVLLGGGIPLFGPLLERKNLTLLHCTSYPQSGLLALTYTLALP